MCPKAVSQVEHEKQKTLLKRGVLEGLTAVR
jgi:hypothetical protein